MFNACRNMRGVTNGIGLLIHCGADKTVLTRQLHIVRCLSLDRDRTRRKRITFIDLHFQAACQRRQSQRAQCCERDSPLHHGIAL